MAEMTNDFLSKQFVPQKGVKTQYSPSDKLDADKNFKYGMLYEKGEVREQPVWEEAYRAGLHV